MSEDRDKATGEPRKLRKGGANWVDGDRFFGRSAELAAMLERVEEGTHTLLTAQRRMGKTSLVRELLRTLPEDLATSVFVDIEDALGPEDAIAEITARSASSQGMFTRIKSVFANVLREIPERVEEFSPLELKVKLRAGVDLGNWQQKGDELFAALAAQELPVVLAIDELPILVNRILKGHDYSMTPERKQLADQFLSWLRRNAQTHRGRVILILSGSIGLEPILREAGLGAQSNVFPAYELRPWDPQTASACLAALAANYGLELDEAVREEMCRRLRCCIPHHVQTFFDNLHQELRRDSRTTATLEDVTSVYENDMLSVRGQIDLEHYESRLKLELGEPGYRLALEILTEAAINDGEVTHEVLDRLKSAADPDRDSDQMDVLYILEHDGYLERTDAGYRFISGLLQDWWSSRHGYHYRSVMERS